MALEINAIAPDFLLPSTSGVDFKLYTALEQGSVLIYFYPKDNTQTCTQEACDFRDSFEHFRNLNIEIVGISKDSITSHKGFRAKHNLPFHLLSDSSGKVCKLYDALVPILSIPKRITYLIGTDKKVKASFADFFGAASHIRSMKEAAKTL